MTQVDGLFATATGQLRYTIADAMESLGADESSSVSVQSFSNTIPFHWERTGAAINVNLSLRARKAMLATHLCLIYYKMLSPRHPALVLGLLESLHNLLLCLHS